MANEESVSHGKHRKSPEEGAEEASKRRKHHHHSRSHHRHRSKHRHSKHGKQKEDEQLPSPSAIRLDEKEEGEIFDEEECNEKLNKNADSEIESGEIKPDEETSNAKIDESSVDQIVCNEVDTLFDSPRNILEPDQRQTRSREQSPQGLTIPKEGKDERDESFDQIHCRSDRRVMQKNNVPEMNEIAQPRGLEELGKDVDISADMKNGYLVSGDMEHTLEETDDGMHLMNDSGMRDHLRDEFHHGVVSVEGNSEGFDAGWHGLSRHRDSTRNDESCRKKDEHTSGGDFEPSRSREKVRMSPEHEYKRGRREDSPPRARESNYINGAIDHRSQRRRHVDSKSPLRGAEKEMFYKDSDSANGGHTRLRSPPARESLDSKKPINREDRDADHISRRYDQRRSSDPVDANRNSSENKNRSLSPESLRDKLKIRVLSPSYDTYHAEVHSRKRSRSHDRAKVRIPQSRDSSHYRASPQDIDRARPSDLKYNQKNGVDCDRISRHHRFDDRADRHGSRDRARDMDKEQLRDRVISRDRERSSSYNRHVVGEDMLDGWDRDTDRGRDRDTDRGRDRDKDRGGLRDRDRNRDRDAHWDKDKDRARDGDRGREMQRDRDRDRERNMDRERRDKDRSAAGRHYKYDGHNFNNGGQDRSKNTGHRRYDEPEYERDRPRKKESAKDLGSTRHNIDDGKEKAIREEDEQEDYQERVALQLAEREEEDVNRIKEESRKRRQAILEKYKQQQLQVQVESLPQDDGKDENETGVDGKPGNLSSLEKSPSMHPVNDALPESIDNKHDSSDVYVADPLFSVGKSPLQNGTLDGERTSGAGGLGEGSPKSERSEDMFCDDIFGESPAGVRKTAKGDGLHVERSGLHDNWDDAEGYYSYRIGEVLDGRYEVTAAHGKGVFSTVVRAKDLKAGKGDPEEVAIKIIRNNETMYKVGLEELIILKKLVGADPDDKRHCVRFLSSFKYRNHLCLVFESLHMNLRDVLKKFGRNIGLKLTAVRAYAKQLFIALKHLRNCGVLHCDIKPDNMLVNEAKNVLKLCDFGNAMFAGKNEITPYLVSRFYRAPEIILGLPYDHPMDIWSVGCCLYELYLGKVLFPGPSNNEMLRLHMELKGPFPKKMLRKGAFTDQHFDQDLNFYATEEDSVTKKAVKRLIVNIRPKYIGSLISSSPGEDPKMLADFKDLLERIFVLDPEKRMTVSQALNHPFITGK